MKSFVLHGNAVFPSRRVFSWVAIRSTYLLARGDGIIASFFSLRANEDLKVRPNEYCTRSNCQSLLGKWTSYFILWHLIIHVGAIVKS